MNQSHFHGLEFNLLIIVPNAIGVRNSCIYVNMIDKTFSDGELMRVSTLNQLN